MNSELNNKTRAIFSVIYVYYRSKKILNQIAMTYPAIVGLSMYCVENTIMNNVITTNAATHFGIFRWTPFII